MERLNERKILKQLDELKKIVMKSNNNSINESQNEDNLINQLQDLGVDIENQSVTSNYGWGDFNMSDTYNTVLIFPNGNEYDFNDVIGVIGLDFDGTLTTNKLSRIYKKMRGFEL